MAFVSQQFLIFFAVVLAVVFVLPVRARWIWLLGASLFFYGLAEPVFLVQIIAATAAAYWFGLKIEAAPDKAAKQRILTPAIVLLALNLVVFKYTPFFNETLRSMFGLVKADYPFPELHWLLPIGISFYTFQLIAYLIDVFRGLKAERQFGFFALYVTFFPKLVAGPIERAKNLLPQIHAAPAFDYALALAGAQLFLWGAFKKVVIADRIAPFVNAIYNQAQDANGVQVVFATFLYAFQIYADFSGYTDMALGAAMILGYRLTQNFDRPYFAVSIQDFWKRWHISLSSWLTDYVYTPLTRQKIVKIKLFDLMLYSLLITFIVSGFWHGANWTFITWGALHGTYIVVSLLLQKRWNNFARASGLIDRENLYRALKIGVTFALVCFAYIVFRANTMEDAIAMIAALPTGWGDLYANARTVVGGDVGQFLLAVAGIVILMGADVLKDHVNLGEVLAKRRALSWGLVYSGGLAIAVLGAFYGAQQQFIYFRF